MAEENMENQNLSEKKTEQLEKRKQRNWFARYSITIIIVITFLLLVGLLFFQLVPQDSRDLLMYSKNCNHSHMISTTAKDTIELTLLIWIKLRNIMKMKLK